MASNSNNDGQSILSMTEESLASMQAAGGYVMASRTGATRKVPLTDFDQFVFLNKQNPSNTFSEVKGLIDGGKNVVIVFNGTSGAGCYVLSHKSSSALEFSSVRDGKIYYLALNSDDSWTQDSVSVASATAIAPDYSDLTFPVAAGTACMHGGLRYVANDAISTDEEWTPAHWTEKSVEEEIGNVETLLAAL